MAEFDPDRAPDDAPRANPYAPPEAELRPRLPGPTGGDSDLEPFSMDAVVRRAWAVFRARPGISMALVLGLLGLNWACQLAGNLLLTAAAQAGVPAAARVGVEVGYVVGVTAFQVWLGVGQTIGLLRLARGQDAAFDVMFQGGPYLLRYVAASVLCLMLVLAAGVACAAPAVVMLAMIWSDPSGAALFLAVLFAAAGFVALVAVGVRIQQFPYVLVDHDCGVVDAVRGSIEITRGHTLELVLLTLLSTVVAISGVFLCLVGLVVTVPLSLVMMSCTYVLLAGSAGPGFAAKPPADIEFLD